MGLDVLLTKKRTEPLVAGEEDNWDGRCISIPSTKYPEHYFHIGYWRSSYNEGGINRVLESLSMPTLWNLASFGEDCVEVSCDELSWSDRLARAKSMLLEFKNAVNLAEGVCVSEHRDFGFKDVCDSSGEALGKFLAARAEHREKMSKVKEDSRYHSYTCKGGDYWMGDPLKVRAIISGKKDDFGGGVTYLIVECGPDYYDWYIQALEIVVETCEWVLAQDDPEQYELVWSG